MTVQVSKSKDFTSEIGKPQSGIASSTALAAGDVNSGGVLRDLLINYNANVLFERNSAQGNPGFAINANFDIANANAISYTVGGVLKTLAVTQNFDTGTTATITGALWGIAILTYDGTTPTLTWDTTAAAMGYATEALAIAALGKKTSLYPAAGFSGLGYVTVQAGASLWTAGTSALAGGAGGTPATTTNYYNDPTMNGTYGGYQIGNHLGAAITQ